MKKANTKRFNHWSVRCPHCLSESTVRSSKQMCDTVREATITCNNPGCMHSWVAQLVAVRTIAPSMNPKPGVLIPLSPRSPAAQAPVSDQLELSMEHPPPRMASG